MVANSVSNMSIVHPAVAVAVDDPAPPRTTPSPSINERQQQCAQEKAWWPSDKPPVAPVILGSHGARCRDSHLQREIQAAISEPMDKPALPDSQRVGLSSHLVKTSSTHPIK
ncbi:hypothetical protein C0993_004435 [Termitomyces sp. T159_Od127]|nr:hypothetical protein C0993_004435 [Termitomyces sp. T159_Od127]